MGDREQIETKEKLRSDDVLIPLLTHLQELDRYFSCTRREFEFNRFVQLFSHLILKKTKCLTLDLQVYVSQIASATMICFFILCVIKGALGQRHAELLYVIFKSLSVVERRVWFYHCPVTSLIGLDRLVCYSPLLQKSILLPNGQGENG